MARLLQKMLKPFRPINRQNFEPALGNPVGGIRETGLPRIIGESEGFKAKEGQRSGDCPNVMGIADAIQNKMDRALFFQLGKGF